MAPESVKKLEYTRFSDIWSLGCLVIEMVTGEPPWSQYKNPMAVLFQLYNNTHPPEIPDNLSPLCKDFISNCLQVEPKKRHNVYRLLRHPFISGTSITEQLRVNVKLEKKIISTTSKTGSEGSNTSHKSRRANNFFSSKIEEISKFNSNPLKDNKPKDQD